MQLETDEIVARLQSVKFTKDDKKNHAKSIQHNADMINKGIDMAICVIQDMVKEKER